MDSPTTRAQHVGLNVDTALRNAGLSVKSASTQTGIPRTTLTRHLEGKGGGFSADQLEALGDLLHVDPTIFWVVAR